MKRLKGIFLDSDPIDQPQGTYRRVLNGLLTKRNGAIANEGGNVNSANLPTGYSLEGTTLIYDGRTVLFLSKADNSMIATFDGNSITTILTDSRLNFNPNSTDSYNIEASADINGDGDVIVYWTDDLNSPRYINIDNPPTSLTDINELNIFPVINKVPVLNLEDVRTTGGSLETGAYYFGISLINDDGARTGYMELTPPIFINDDSDVSNHDLYDGAPSGTPTSKAIELDIQNLDETYEEYEIVVIKKQSGTVAEVTVLPDQAISSDRDNFLYTGNEGGIDSSLDEVFIDTASYATAKSIAKIDNVLYMGNLTEKPDVGFQKFANNITTKAITKPINEDTDAGSLFSDGHYGNPKIAFRNKSFKRGEVYAFYVAFVLNNGQQSKAYHIPGREAVGDELDNADPQNISDGSGKRFQFYTDHATKANNYMGYWQNETDEYPTLANDEADNWKIFTVDANGDPVDTGNTLHGEKVRHHHFPKSEDSSYPISDYYNDTDRDRAQTLGVEFSDIQIPDEILDQVVGMKFFYAKRTDANKRILDQGFSLPLDDKSPRSNVQDNIVLRYSPNAPSIRKYIQVKAFNLLRTQANIGGLTHIEILNRPQGDAIDYVNTTGFSFDNPYSAFTRKLFDLTQTKDDDENFNDNKFRKIDGGAKAYIREDAFNETISKGFDYNVDNKWLEETIALQLTNSLDFGTINYTDSEDVSMGLTVNLCSYKTDLYVSFDQQELVWTGRTITDLDQFSGANVGSAGTTAEGSITVNQGTDDLLSALDDYQITLDGDVISVDVGGNQNEDVLAALIAETIRLDSSRYTATAVDSVVTITALDNGTAENGTITVTAGNTGIAATDTDLTGGVDNSNDGSVATGSIQVTSGADNGLAGTRASFTGSCSGQSSANEAYRVNINFYGQYVETSLLANNADEQDIIEAISVALNNNSTITNAWNITTNDPGGSSYEIIITAKEIGDAFNDESINISFQEENSGDFVISHITFTPTLTDGGTDSSLDDLIVTLADEDITTPIALDGDVSVNSIAEEIADSINTNSISYGASVSGDTVTVTSDNLGVNENGTVSVAVGNTTVATTTSDLTGGEDKVEDGSKASGTLTITSGTNIVVGQATGTIDVTQKPDVSTNYYINVNFYGEVVQTELLTPSDGTDTITDAIATALTSNSAIDADWDVDVNFEGGFGNNDYQIIITSKAGGTQWNNKFIDITSEDEDNNPQLIQGITGSSTSGGSAPLIEDIKVTVNGNVFEVDVNEEETASQIAVKIRDKINALSFDYTATVSGTVITITADEEGREYNGSIFVDARNTGSEFSTDSLAGGTGPPNSGAVFGGDTFIGAYGFRVSGEERKSGQYNYLHKYIIYFVCESEDNIKLRHSDPEDRFVIYYPKHSHNSVLDAEFRKDKEDGNEDDGADYAYIGPALAYNMDYSEQADLKTPIPLLKDFEEITDYPTRVIRSAEGNQNLLSNVGIRTFLANDYIDLTRSRGELVTLTVLDNILIPHMERSLIRTKGREELVTGDFRAYLGAGDIFAARPDELSSTKEGYAGIQDPRSAVTTPYGYFFIDKEARQVFMIAGGPDIISDRGLSEFFDRELAEITGDGQLISTWDSRHERIIVTCKQATTNYPNGWTLSYYPQLKIWGSFHSYIPDSYFYTVNSFYSTKNNSIYKHNDDTNLCTFYGQTYPFEFDFVSNPKPQMTKQTVNISFITEIEDQNGDKYYKETFDTFRITNTYQDSGEQNINYFTGANGNARHVEGTWKINKFRNMLSNGSIDLNKPWYEQDRFKGKYGQVKLTYSNSDNKFIYLYDTNIGFKESYR